MMHLPHNPQAAALNERRRAVFNTIKLNRQAEAEGKVHPTDKQGVPIPPPEPEGGDE